MPFSYYSVTLHFFRRPLAAPKLELGLGLLTKGEITQTPLEVEATLFSGCKGVPVFPASVKTAVKELKSSGFSKHQVLAWYLFCFENSGDFLL